MNERCAERRVLMWETVAANGLQETEAPRGALAVVRRPICQ